jgi:hypothetical protein
MGLFATGFAAGVGASLMAVEVLLAGQDAGASQQGDGHQDERESALHHSRHSPGRGRENVIEIYRGFL